MLLPHAVIAFCIQSCSQLHQSPTASEPTPFPGEFSALWRSPQRSSPRKFAFAPLVAVREATHRVPPESPAPPPAAPAGRSPIQPHRSTPISRTLTQLLTKPLPARTHRNSPNNLLTHCLAAAIGQCLVERHAKQPRLPRWGPCFVAPLRHLHKRGLQHVGGQLGIPQDALQKPPQLLAMLDVQGRHYRRIELLGVAFADRSALIVRG